MTSRQGLPVAGYTDQSSDKVDLVNENKILEEQVLRQIDKLISVHRDQVDLRMTSIAKTEIQTAFMWLNRALFQPQRVSLPDDSH